MRPTHLDSNIGRSECATEGATHLLISFLVLSLIVHSGLMFKCFSYTVKKLGGIGLNSGYTMS